MAGVRLRDVRWDKASGSGICHGRLPVSPGTRKASTQHGTEGTLEESRVCPTRLWVTKTKRSDGYPCRVSLAAEGGIVDRRERVYLEMLISYVKDAGTKGFLHACFWAVPPRRTFSTCFPIIW
ncbi:unnamed protein product [Ectocarpus sp. 6 AP-2014]